MATGFTVMDALNKNSKAGIEETPKARFRTKDISIFKMYRNEMNFYSIADVESLAGDILTFGLKQNLELVYEPCEKGEYRIVAGERRWLALKYLVSQGYKEFEIATSKLTTPQDSDEEQVEIIIANAYRDKSLSDELEEEKRLKTSLERLRAAGKKIKGYDISEGRLREVIVSMLHTSRTKVAQIEAINNNLIPELKEEIKNERLGISAAYELSGMSEPEQRKVLEQYMESDEIPHKEVKAIKDKRTGQEESGKSVAEAEKTKEQDKIEREMKNQLQDSKPPASSDNIQKAYQIRTGTTVFNDICNGERTFDIQKNDIKYKKGDSLEMMEFSNGKYTGRTARVLVTYVLEDYTGLKEDYCILALKIECTH